MRGEQAIPEFIRFESDEQFDRDYYITHTSKRRFPFPVLTLCGTLLGFPLLMTLVILTRPGVRFGNAMPVLLLSFIPGILTTLYFALRRLKITHGHAAVTNRRVIYYEYNDHPEENFHRVESLHLADITGVRFFIDQTWIRRTFVMVFWTERKGLAVGATGLRGFFSFLQGASKLLEPGPDALSFLQTMSGQIAARQHSPSGSRLSPSPVGPPAFNQY